MRGFGVAETTARDLRCAGAYILQQRKDDAVCEICGKVQLLVNGLLLAAFFRIANVDAPGCTVDCEGHRFFESWPLLQKAIVAEAKNTALGKYDRLVEKRSVFKMEHETTCEAITVCKLREVAIGQGFALQCAQDQKTVDYSFGVENADRKLGLLRARCSRGGKNSGTGAHGCHGSLSKCLAARLSIEEKRFSCNALATPLHP